MTEPLPAQDGEKAEEKQPWSHGALLPVPVVLRDFATRGLPPVGEEAAAAHLWSFLEAELRAAALGDFAPVLEQTLRLGRALVLLDGLDEVPEAEGRRDQLLQAIDDFAATFGKCRFLVTCRTYAYREQKWRLPGFGVVVLAALSEAQVRCFVDRWYAHVAEVEHRDRADVQGSAEGLKRAIFASDRLQALAERPLLLTLMASLHAWHGGTLPEKREELYAAAVDLLLHSWEQRRLVKDQAGRPVLLQPSLAEWLQVDRDEVRRLLDRLAFEAHAAQPKLEGTADIAEKDLVAGLLEVANNPDARPVRLVEFLRDRAGLLVARAVGVYTFPHRTFQEYLAACHLTDCDFPDKVAELARSGAERWREVTLLAGAKAARGSSSSVWLLAKELCDEEPAQREKRLEDARGAQLAGVLLAESGDLKRVSEKQRKTLDRVRRWQVALMRGSELPARDRAECGRSVAVLGDPRPEVLTVEAMEFCRVPAGPFWMGSEASDPQSYDDERPAGVYELDYDYEIGRFPVTQAQYQEFVEAGGYREARFWTDTRFDRGERPKTFGGSFDLANHPVVGVSWFEAVAYCQWLTERLSAFGRLEPGWYSRLPNEPEWEKAARGGLGMASNQRLYPWGEAPSAEFCNFLETGILLSNAVGCFKAGASPWGCEDLSGNVWEWTRSQWGMETEHQVFGYPYRPEDGREVIDSPNVRCVLRGGAFHYNKKNIRCSVRNRLKLFSRSIDVGFRVVLAHS
ncbi:MAG: SUMF1/EgtB/PvdO family nonheme iron enzyme [Thermoanaerobaculia bacterium]|nr:SUMF1/EgtB/PvdO family nonheme iron enzyme [Thermoanaerobaculia bacterium]